jgi:hypothetical protein
MGTLTADEDSRISFWRRVREFAVPPSMIETATARRHAGDWAGACAAARVETDLDLRSLANTHGQVLASRVRADLRRLAPDLLRWHLPRIAPDGLLRPGLTVALARYGPSHGEQLVVRTAPAWADAGQRISLAVWDGSGAGSDVGVRGQPRAHPHPRPSRRFRLDLHRHLWDADRAGELRGRSGADRLPPRAGNPPPGDPSSYAPSSYAPSPCAPPSGDPLPVRERGCAVDRWADEAAILLRAEGRDAGPVLVRLGGRRRMVLDLAAGAAEGGLGGDGSPGDAVIGRIRAVTRRDDTSALPVLPDAATWVLPDLELLRAGLIEAGELHPLVAAALVPGDPQADGVSYGWVETPDRSGRSYVVECRGARHRIGFVDGVLTPLDHDPDEIRREELLAALTGTPLPCLQSVDKAHRRPDCLDDVRDRLLHGDTEGALAVVEGVLGREATLRDGALRDVLEDAAQRRVVYGLFREGLADPAGPGPGFDVPFPGGWTNPSSRRTSRRHRHRPRHASRP